MVEQALPNGQTSLTLRTGRKMPQGGFGLWKLGKDVTPDVIVNAVEAGYRLFDGASDYGNEKEVGEGLRRVFEAGKVKREELFIVSKLWNQFHGAEHVKPALERSLKDLGLDYVDLYLIHFPIALKYVDPEVRYPPSWKAEEETELTFAEGVTYQQTYHAMEACQEAGLTKDIGCSNLQFQQFREVFQYCKIKPAVLQIEMHPFCIQAKLLRFVQESGTQMMAYSNLGGASYIEIGLAGKNDVLSEVPTIVDLGKKYEKTPAQICLRWAVQRGCVIVPKTATKSRLPENIDVFNWTMTADEMKSIDALDKNQRFNDPGNYAEGMGTFYPMYA